MITRHFGGDMVKGGVYWSSSNAEFVSIPPEGGRLEGSSSEWYLMAPLPLVLVVGSLMGLAFIVFLPLSGLLVVVAILANKLRNAMSTGELAARVASPHAQPGVSYLQPRLHQGPTEQTSRRQSLDERQDGKLFDLAREIADRRWQDK